MRPTFTKLHHSINQSQYPMLSRLAWDYLAIQGSSVASEGSFQAVASQILCTETVWIHSCLGECRSSNMLTNLTWLMHMLMLGCSWSTRNNSDLIDRELTVYEKEKESSVHPVRTKNWTELNGSEPVHSCSVRFSVGFSKIIKSSVRSSAKMAENQTEQNFSNPTDHNFGHVGVMVRIESMKQ